MVRCSIPFSAEHPRKVAKATGGVWNPTQKVWEFQEAESANDISPKLRGYIVPDQQVCTQQSSAKTYNTGLGYYGTAADASRGYDGIESETF